LALVAPAGCELEDFVEVGVEWEPEGGEERPLRDEAEAGLGVEEFGESATEAGGVSQQVGCGGERDAGPVAQ
jgi:hypothetical protein